MTHVFRLASSPFEMIKRGEKTIELRLWDEKRQLLSVGDMVCFQNTVGGEELQARVLALHRFDSFCQLYRALPLLRCGYTEETVETAKASDMDIYYPPERQKQYGVVGIELEVVKSYVWKGLQNHE